MKFFAAIAVCLVLCSCADYGVTTKVYSGGKIVLETGADIQNLDFSSGDGTRLKATVMNHSSAILANGAATSQIIDATGHAVVGVGGVVLTGILAGGIAPAHPATALAVGALPAIVNQVPAVVQPRTTNLIIQHQWMQSHGTPTPTPGVKHRRHHRHRAHNTSPPKDE
jgi:hypothetical protein